MANVDLRIEKWKKRLLDLGKRNRLINYRETKRSNIAITSPNLTDLYTKLVLSEETLAFSYTGQNDFDDVELIKTEPVYKGDIETNRTIKEQQKTLGSLRSKTKIATEEQGVNILYLSFGFLRWTEIPGSTQVLVSPIILVPVTLTLESITSPFMLALHEDEVIVNPTLFHKLENDFGIVLPSFDGYDNDVETYLNGVKNIVENNRWDVTFDVGLSLLSFLKINMYKDLERNKDRIAAHAIIRALSGDPSGIISLPEEFDNFNHDEKTKPIDTYQVLDADASQQDAILYSKKGASFVLQGPPGTGKSQTITNIIAESLADGKKVLFVSAKDAALKVVHKRLSQVGLADFCLNLHSHKANKKEILNELGKTLSLNKFKIQEDAIYQLEALKTAKDTLNKYTAELHTHCPPLGNSIYEVNGKIAKLHDTPDIIFHLEKVRETSPERLNLFRHLLENFSSTIGKMSEDYAANPWRSCNVQNVSHELRHDIETKLRQLLPKLKNLSDFASECINDLGIDKKLSIRYLGDLISILGIASLSPKVPVSWMVEEDIAGLSTRAEKFKDLTTEYQFLLGDLSLNYIDGFSILNAKEVLAKLKKSMDDSRQMLNSSKYTSDEEIAASAQDVINTLNMCLGGIEKLQTTSDKSVELFGVKSFRNINDAIIFTDFLDQFLSRPKPTQEWFDKEKFNILKRLFTEAKNKHEELEKEKKNVLSEYEAEILDLDYSSMLKRFKVDYSSVLKVLKKNYWADRKTIKSLAISESYKTNDDATFSVLNHLKAIADIKRWLAENNELIITLFGVHYNKEYTDWVDFEKAICAFQKILEYYDESGVPQKTRDLLLSTEVGTTEIQLNADLKDLWNQRLHTIVDQTLDFAGNATSIDFNTFTVGLKNVLSKLSTLSTEYQKMMQFCIPEVNFDDALANLVKLERLQEIARKIKVEHKNLQARYEFLFNGIDTDWEQILNALIWTNEFRKLNAKHNFSHSFIKKICLDEASIEFSKNALEKINQKFGDIQTEWEWYLSLFNDKNELLNTEIYELLVRIENSFANLSALEEWIDYRVSREQCKENGLTDYIEQVETLRIDKSLIIPSFLKRFYRLWLDAVAPNYPAVNSFRRRTQDALVKQFSELDKKQLSIARARVKHRLVSRLPDFNNKFTSAVDEVGTLKRELNKQRKIMPLRKLFRAIPNLLVTLKPCLMMSPLSVSLFLEDENYNFDIVIFDEASQVCTEDSIGAIMRGRQVVIAGDSKQLPPTNFFATSTSDNDFDTIDEEDEYDDTDAYQSILDESVTVLAERTLRWHYRSRHEHLIAFSNAKVYKNSLITFPSNIERVPDNGVEYIRVPNGIYDRSGKRINVVEAKKVAELVFEHIRDFPDRSLGVVTFSEAQCEAVEAAVRQLRMLNLQHEKFFSDEKEESFFVKNLERVQGDERDTIIFSIGYAKDQNGVMYMNFGPLSKDGGYRRLNVAITRAKYNVKLVGSILPTDLNTENITAEGVKMLRSYIDFAINGPDVIYGEITVPETISVESPFEESVYDFLISKGCKVTTQIGCSGYRIDMAVKHPKLDGVFVLGIECDGATYHSARTARERDRLRQAILEDIGWKIYRIWSTDWIKDPVSEGQKLLDAVNEAISAYGETYHGFKRKHNDDQNILENNFASLEIPILSTLDSTLDSPNPYNFHHYKEADIRKVSRKSAQSVYQANVIKFVIEEEYPIHIELLCKRVASIFGYQNATSTVRSSVLMVLNKQLKGQVKKVGDFFWIKDNKIIRVRIPDGIDPGRKIDHICIEEIAEAMFVIAGKSVGILQNDLLVATARMFGFNRAGGNITQAMQEASDYLLENGKVKNFSGKIIVA